MHLLVAVLSMPVVSRDSLAQQVPPYNQPTEVFRERIVVPLPLPYLSEKRPNPSVNGYYVYKVVFGSDDESTIVYRTNEPLRATTDRQVLRASSFWLCPKGVAWALKCDIPVKGSARIGADALILEITEPSVVKRVRSRSPDIAIRQVFHPGGRFRVDHVNIRYR